MTDNSDRQRKIVSTQGRKIHRLLVENKKLRLMLRDLTQSVIELEREKCRASNSPPMHPNQIAAAVADMRNKGQLYVPQLGRQPLTIQEWADRELERWNCARILGHKSQE